MHREHVYIAIALAIASVFTIGSQAQELNKVKLKAFVDEVPRPFQLRLPLDLTTADNGDVLAFYPEKALQPPFVDQKNGPDGPMLVSWEREKLRQNVDKEPYLVYGRSPLTPLACRRFQEQTYLFCTQERGKDKLGIIRSTIKGAGLTPSPCHELCEMPVSLNDLKERNDVRTWGYTAGLHTIRSSSGKTMLMSLIGNLSQGAKYAPISMAIVDKDLHVIWQDALFLGDPDRGTNVLDMMLINDSTIAILTGHNTKVSDGSIENKTMLYMMGPGVMNNTQLEFDEHFIQDGRLKLTEDGHLQCTGIAGQKKAKAQRTVAVFNLLIAPDLSIAQSDIQEVPNASEELELAGVEHGKKGSYVVTCNYEIKGIAAGAGGAKLKNAKYHSTGVRVHHLASDGDFGDITDVPMKTFAEDLAMIVPVSMAYNDELFLFFNDHEENMEHRKKGREMESVPVNYGDLNYIQMDHKGNTYSRALLKGDDRFRNMFAYHAWQLSDTELFTLVKRGESAEEYHLMKVQLEQSER